MKIIVFVLSLALVFSSHADSSDGAADLLGDEGPTYADFEKCVDELMDNQGYSQEQAEDACEEITGYEEPQLSGPGDRLGETIPLRVIEDGRGFGLDPKKGTAVMTGAGLLDEDVLGIGNDNGKRPQPNPKKDGSIIEEDNEIPQRPSDPADAGKLLFQADDEKANVLIEQDGSFVLIPASKLIDALQLIATVDIEISPETKTVLVAGSFATTALVLFKYGRAMTPAGAFVFALGIGPASAADLCSLYENEEGLKYFFSLSIQKQASEASYCPALAGKIISASEQMNRN